MRTKKLIGSLSPFVTAIVILLLCQPLWADTTVAVGTDPSKFVLKGTIITPDEVINGEIVIEGQTITCVAEQCTHPDGATVLTITNAFIFPGFIDAHNHVAYNFLPKWTPPKLYENRGQWQRAQSYKNFKKPYTDLKDNRKLFCEMVKYGEMKSLMGGVTTIQGTAPNNKCFSVLVRNAENQNNLSLPGSHIRTYLLDIGSFKGTVNWAVTRSFVVHLSEGLDEKSRREFETLKAKGLLTDRTVIIHGTAFGEEEFAEMASTGAKLVWSPQSNLVLYGQTTKVDLAINKGVSVSLGVDWNPSGSNSILDEIRVAHQVNLEKLSGLIKEGDWLRMITVNPAKALALDSRVGRLIPGLMADITVLKLKDQNPNKSLLKSHLQDVEMVWIGGVLLYSDAAIMETMKPAVCEPITVYGSLKRICVKDARANVDKSTQTLSEIKENLQMAYPGLAPLTP